MSTIRTTIFTTGTFEISSEQDDQNGKTTYLATCPACGQELLRRAVDTDDAQALIAASIDFTGDLEATLRHTCPPDRESKQTKETQQCRATLTSTNYRWNGNKTIGSTSKLNFNCTRPRGHQGPHTAPRADRDSVNLNLPSFANVTMYEITWPNRQRLPIAIKPLKGAR